MGTRSLTFVHEDRDSDPIICIYQQYDGYFSGGVGDDILSFLKGTEIVNGFGGGDTSRQFNGAGDLAARLVTHFKSGDATVIGNVYIQDPSRSADEGIAYHIYCTVGQEPYLVANEYDRTVEGPISQIVWPDDKDDEPTTAVDNSGPLTDGQRNALFAAFGNVFAETTDQARYAFTAMVLGRTIADPVSWSSKAWPRSITSAEASKVLDALDALNV